MIQLCGHSYGVENCHGRDRDGASNGIEISIVCGSALMMSTKSSRLPSMELKLTSVTDFVIAQ
jgi:hypothetical protein